MTPPMSLRNRRTAAHPAAGRNVSLAQMASAPNAGRRLARVRRVGPILLDHPPSHDLRPDRLSAGRTFPGRDHAGTGRKFAAPGKLIGIAIAAGTALRESAFIQPEHRKRGSSPCASSFFFRSSSRRLPAVCRTPCRAAPVAPSLVPSSPMPRVAAHLPAPLSVAWLVPRPAASTSACRRAVRATDLIRAASLRRPALLQTTRSLRPRVVFSCLAPAVPRASEEDQCSRRS